MAKHQPQFQPQVMTAEPPQDMTESTAQQERAFDVHMGSYPRLRLSAYTEQEAIRRYRERYGLVNPNLEAVVVEIR